MELHEQVGRILQSQSGQGVCDACLAFALEAPLKAIQGVTSTLITLASDYARLVGTCSNCSRVTTTTACVATSAAARMEPGHDAQRKCVRCSRRVTQAEEHVAHGDLFHRQCWAIVCSEAQIANSRQIVKISQLLTRRARARLSPKDADGSG
jgi:hypothetical protein